MNTVAQRGQRGVEGTMLGVIRFTQVGEGFRSSELCRRSKIRVAVAWAKSSKIRWAGNVMRFADTRPTNTFVGLFRESPEQRCGALRVPRARRIHWTTLAHDRDECSGDAAGARSSKSTINGG
ncbi:unnamed protein product [Heligmosomoides polygyrus]|uniref:Transposase n=1 Tax=Heligmosomoides polygyrus TaxID=6339 RepID=A0A183FYJ8_HELPZ|nr:unnamed protein product [Heligmosomoides polygyrus]